LHLRDRLPTWYRYLLALLIAALTTSIRLSLERYLAAESPFLLFYPAVFLAVFYLGLGPGLLCLAACIFSIGYFLVPPTGWFKLDEPTDITDIALFVALATAMGFLMNAKVRAHDREIAANRQIQEYAAQLEHEVAERKRVEEALRQANADQEDFSHMVMHDLKEPLRGIAATAKFVMDDYGKQLPPEGHKQLETLVRLPARMATMLDSLMTYARLSRADLKMVPHDVGNVVSEVVDSLRPWLAQRQAEVIVATPLPTLLCDRVHLQQVYNNLITNAVKYNDSESKRVEVGMRPDGVLYVKDNGIGIPPNQVGQLFRMFRRLHPQDRYGGGTGAGLALIKKAIERQGGQIWLESTPGEGTTFFFTLCTEPPATARCQSQPGHPAHTEVKLPQQARAGGTAA
jgi:signal transduction histidine kinase